MTQPVENYEELCRLCASYDSIKMEIFSDRGKERKLLDKITTCLPFQVAEDDPLPKSLCYKCIYNLESFYDFRRVCIDALTRLEDVVKRCYPSTIKENWQTSFMTNSDGGFPDLAPPPAAPRQLSPREIKSEYNETINSEPQDTSDGDCYQPNPADFLEAYLGEELSPVPHSNSPQTVGNVGRRHEDDEGPFSCGVCSRLFVTRSSLALHAKHHRERHNGEEKEMFSCYVCEKMFSSKGHLALHSRVHLGDHHTPPGQRTSPANIKLYRCDLCSKSYSMAKHLWGHVSTSHRGDPLVTCSICLRTFSSVSNLEDHKRIKHKNNNFDQPLNHLTPEVELAESNTDGEKDDSKKPCEEASSNRRKSTKPRKIERGETGEDNTASSSPPSKSTPEVSNTCVFCGVKFENYQSLSEHAVSVHGCDAPFAAGFNQDSYHESEFAESLVESETIFCCEICIREFSDKASLWLHMLYSHRDEASKACGVCLKICSDNESLIQHVELTHPRDKTEQRRYSCQVCARQHDSRKKLVTHAKIHKLTDAEGNLIDPETVVVLNSEFYGSDQTNSTDMVDDSFMMHCEICYKVFETEAKLVKHKRSVHRESMGGNNSTGSSSAYHYFFACEICGLSHSSRSERWRHISISHAGDPSVTCDAEGCGKVFPTSSVKKEHAEVHHQSQGQFPNTCEVCGKLWKTRVEYWKHMMGVHADFLPFICGVCLKVFCNVSDLVSHVRASHWPLNGGDFCCDICGRPYSKMSKMTRHRKIHNVPETPPEIKALLENLKIETETHFLQQPSSYTCEHCEGGGTEEFDSLESLNKHRRAVHNVMPCDLCTKCYGRTSHLWKHVNKIHKGHPEITCQLCQRTSASRLHLANHMAKHHRSEETIQYDSTSNENGDHHSCEKCAKVFRKQSLMKKHMKHCKGPRSSVISCPVPVNGVYSCEKCEKTFTVASALSKHMRNSHIPFNCELCGMSTDSKTELYDHVKKEHSTDPQVKCDIEYCEEILRTPGDLERHKRDHKQSIQLHICKFCAELISSKVKMRKHLKMVHAKETKHLCALCLKALPSFDMLRSHVAELHSSALSRPHTCPICAKPCPNRSKLLEHIKYHGDTFHPCKICVKILNSKEEYDNHIANHAGDSCDEEDQIEEVDLDTKSILDIIGAPHKSPSPPRTPSDDDESDSKRRSDESEEEEDDDEEETVAKKPRLELTCSDCPVVVSSMADLIAHQKIHHGDLVCPHCTLVSTKPSEHEEHVSVCTGGRGLASTSSSSILEAVLSEGKREENDSILKRSETDDKAFMHQLGLMPESDRNRSGSQPKQTRKVYTDDFSPSMCEVCNKVWPAKRHLWQHLIRFHRAEAGTSCGVCLKLCLNYTGLAAHLGGEHPENFEGEGTNLTCRVCGKYHNARSKLQNHVAIHVGHEERGLSVLHRCLHCPSVFTAFGSLVDHNLKNHDYQEVQKRVGKKPSIEVVAAEAAAAKKPEGKEKVGKKLPFFSCDVCALVFASGVGLTNHRRLHENSDNFKCGQCGEVFSSADGLGTHKLQRHKGAEFVCADCKSNFGSYQLLTEHNKQCKIKLKNAERDTPVEDDDALTMDIDEVEEDSALLNGTTNHEVDEEEEEDVSSASDSDPEEKVGVDDEDDEDDELSDNEEEEDDVHSMASEEESLAQIDPEEEHEELEDLLDLEVIEVRLDGDGEETYAADS